MAAAGDVIGPWTLESRLGEGGNAVVWRATHDDGRAVALKLINARKAGREPYRRFVREIEFLKSLGSFPGVMPVLDSYLPAAPDARDRPWLAMPIATPIDGALEEEPLEVVVAALAAIADALDRLQDQHDVAHRDIKPANLYRHTDEFVVGDFGLVALPDQEELTRSNRPLGPAHYLPYEMLADPASADPHKADVFSLGKTLWVLACRQNYPPQGHQPHNARGFAVADTRPHPNAGVLDRLVDRMTRIRPDERPTKAEAASELSAWASLKSGLVTLDLSAARKRLHQRMAAELSAQDLAEERRDLAHAAIRRLNELCAPLNDALRDLHPRAEIDQMGDQFTQNMLKSRARWGSVEIELFWHRMSTVSFGAEPRSYALRLGRGIELTDAGDLIFRVYVDVGHPRTSGTDFHWESPDWTAPVGTTAAESLLAEGVEELARQVEAGVAVFVERLEARGDA